MTIKKGKDINSSSWTAKEILETEMPDVPMIIEGLLPLGMFWIAGKKKIGKSYLILQLMVAIASKTGKFLGKDIRHGRVLYISFEDNPRRIKKRLITLKTSMDLDNLELEFAWKPLNKGGYEDLVKRLKQKNYILCILDTWSWAFELKDSNKQDEAMKYLKPIHNITKEGKTCIGFVDHHHKTSQFSGDLIDDISGTGAKGGIADTVWMLVRKRGEREMTLDVSSKDIDDDIVGMKLTLRDGELVPVNENEIKPNTIQSSIMSQIQYWENLQSGHLNYLTEIAGTLKKDKSLVSRELGELVNKGAIHPVKDGKRVIYQTVNGYRKSEKKVN